MPRELIEIYKNNSPFQAVDKIVSQMMAESETFESIFDSVKSIGSHKDRLEVDENR